MSLWMRVLLYSRALQRYHDLHDKDCSVTGLKIMLSEEIHLIPIINESSSRIYELPHGRYMDNAQEVYCL